MTITETTASTTAEAGVRDLLQASHAAWAANDADAFADLYDTDATVAVNGIFRNGRDEIRSHMTGAFAGPFAGSSLIEEVSSIHYPTSDVAVVVSESGILLAGAAQVTPERMVRATWTLHRGDDDTWRVTAYASGPNRPA
jgi:uncharacterized protein (TIGR02246 family)